MIFIISGFGKMTDSAMFANLIRSYGFVKLSFLAPIIIILEIYLGLNLVLLKDLRKTAFALLVLLFIFSLAYTNAFVFEGVKDCGCFGTMGSSKMPVFLTFLRNFILIILLVILVINHNNISNNQNTWKSNIILSIIFVSGFIIGNTYERHPVNTRLKNRLDPRTFIGQNINETPLKLISLNTKSQLIFILSSNCPHCINSIENIKRINGEHMVDSSIVYLSIRESYDSLFYANCDLYFEVLETDILETLTTVYPTTFYIRNDTIKNVILGIVPSYFILNKINNQDSL